MSRCFPFPPPGYESKNRPEDLDILKEAKRKEKKHKKEKDKERKKDKKEKDGSDDKQRDKKDGKEKHKDKKEKHKDKDKKDRSKDKEKTSTSVETTVSAKLGEKYGEKLHPKEHIKPKKSAVHEGGDPFLFQTHSQSTLHSISKETDDSKFVQELDRRIRDDKDRKSQLQDRIPNSHDRDQETAARAAVSSSSKVPSEEKGNNKDNRVNCAKMDLDSLRNEFDRSKVVQNLIPVVESKVEEFPRPPDTQNEWRLQGKDKDKETGESKCKDEKKDGDKKSHGKEKVMEKENKKEKAKVKSKRDMSKVVGKNDFVCVSNSSKSKDSSKDVNRSAEGNIRKRKDIETNGFLHEIKASPNKRQRPAPHESIVNGSKPEESSGTPSKASKPEEASGTPSKSSYDKPIVHNHIHADKKERLINGIITKGQIASLSKPNPPAPTMAADRAPKPVHESIVEGQIAESSRRRPSHPDSKYLADVLSVPTVMNISENDDDEQEWLFSNRGPSDKRVGAKEEVCVWSEAVHIESADVCALPYVIPY